MGREEENHVETNNAGPGSVPGFARTTQAHTNAVRRRKP